MKQVKPLDLAILKNVDLGMISLKNLTLALV
jgi:hypothetical protein